MLRRRLVRRPGFAPAEAASRGRLRHATSLFPPIDRIVAGDREKHLQDLHILVVLAQLLDVFGFGVVYPPVLPVLGFGKPG